MMTKVSNYAVAIILCLHTACNCILSTVGQYIYIFYLQLYSVTLNSTQNLTVMINTSYELLETVNDSSEQCTDDTYNYGSIDAQLWAQEQSADLFFRIGLWNSCPIIVMTYILGLYTPTLGRRFVLVLPMIGTSIQLSIWLAIIYFHLEHYWWYIASFIVGLSGSTSVLNFVINLIITDNTQEINRSSRFVLFEAMTTAVNAIVTFGIGYYIEWRGFIDLYWISLSLQLLSIIIVIFFIKKNSPLLNESNVSLLSVSSSENDVNTQTKGSHSFKTYCKDFLIIFTVFGFKNRSRKKSICLLLTLFAYIFYLLACSAYAPFLWYLLNVPFCWSSEDVGNYIAISSISCAIFSVLGLKLFTRFGANDTMICIISHLCYAIASFCNAFAKHSWQLYAGLITFTFADYQNSLTLPLISKWLEPYERTHAFTLVAEVNTIITSFADSFFNWIYARTVYDYHNFTLLMSAGFSLVAFTLNLCLLAVTQRMSDKGSGSSSQLEPLVLPIDDTTYFDHIIVSSSSSSPSHLISLSQTSTKDRSRSKSQSSTDSELILTEDLISL